MTLDSIIQIVVEFVRNHEHWAIPIVFILAFGESLAFLSLLLPATVILLGLGALIGESGIAFWPLWIAASAGAFLGDWVSYWVGDRYQHQVEHMWPLSRHPQMMARGHTFFERWGTWGVFIGRFWSTACSRPFGCGDMWHAAALFSASQFAVGDSVGICHVSTRRIWHSVAQWLAGLSSHSISYNFAYCFAAFAYSLWTSIQYIITVTIRKRYKAEAGWIPAYFMV